MLTRRARLAAAVAAAGAGCLSAAVLAVGGAGGLGGAYSRGLTIYGRSHALLALALAAVGLLLLVVRRSDGVVALLGVAVLLAALLAGAGIVGRRRWPLYWGCCSPKAVTEGELVRTLATAMGVVCALAALVCVVVLLSGLSLSGSRLALTVAVPVALVVAIVVPRIMVGGWEDEREVVARALMYSLPIGATLVLAAAMPRLAALAVVAATVAAALVLTTGEPFILFSGRLGNEATATWVVVVACLVVAAARLMTHPRWRT